jgi:hypothetical protein
MIAIVHNYEYGGSVVTLAWDCASDVTSLVAIT